MSLSTLARRGRAHPAPCGRARVGVAAFATLLACGEPAAPELPASEGAGITGIEPASSSGDDGPPPPPDEKLDLGAPQDLPLPPPGACAATTLGASLSYRPVDVILVIDTSSSMDPVSSAVEANINESLAQMLADSGLDYRVVAIANYGAGASLCIAAPLGNDDCSPPGPLAPVGPRLFQYSIGLGSGSFLQAILSTYAMPPSAVQAGWYDEQPMGWGEWVRADALKIFIGITDAEEMSNSPAGGDSFDAGLLALDPLQFGTADARNYVFHTIAGLAQNNPATAPWPPDAPIVNTDCVGFSGKEPGQPMQQVSILTGGLRYPLCEYGSFDALFETVATGVVEVVPISCDLAIPPAPEGDSIDPDTLEVQWTDATGAVHLFHQVPAAAACEPDAFWVDAATIHLCADACANVQADDAGEVAIRYGCDVGYDPNG
jgi:hypothetical protein